MAKKFEEIKEEEYPYELPEGWKWERLGDINKFKSKNLTPQDFPEETFELYSVPNFVYDYPEILKGKEIGSSKQIVDKEDVLLCKINPNINRVWTVSRYTNNRMIASGEWIVFRNSEINSHMIKWYFTSPYFRTLMMSNVSGVGGSLTRAKPKLVANYLLPIPPKETQQKIVGIIESLFAKLDIAQEKVEQVLAESENRRSAILHNAFSGKLTEKWREENNVSFDSWSKTNFSDIIIQMQNGLSKRNGESGLLYGVLRLANINEYSINLNDLRYILLDDKEQEKYALRENDVIMIRVNGSKDNVGKQILVPQMNNIAFCDHIIRIVYNNEIVMVKFMVLLSYTKDYRNYIEEHMVSSAGQNTISRKGMNDYNINLPTILEQQEIVRLLDNFLSVEDKVKSTCQNTLEAIATMRKSILAKAFRGELCS